MFMYIVKQIEKYDTKGERISINDQLYDIYVSYTLGGMNYFTGKVEKRGYWLHINLIQSDGGFTFYRAFTGIKQFLEPTTRFNQKKLSELADSVLSSMHKDPQKYLDMLQFA